MKGYIVVYSLNKISKGLTMQINFHSLLWYSPIFTKGADIFGHDIHLYTLFFCGVSGTFYIGICHELGGL